MWRPNQFARLAAALLAALLAPALASVTPAPPAAGPPPPPPDDWLRSGPVFQSFFDAVTGTKEPAFCIVADQKGYIWSGAQDGAHYYNGREWIQIELPNRARSSRVNAIVPSVDGSLWFATNGGGLAQLRDGTWTVHDTRNSGLPNDTVWSLIETETGSGGHVLWAGTAKGLARLENGAWTVYNQANSGLPDDLVWTVREVRAPTGSRALWVGTTGGGLARFADGSWEVYDTSNGLPNNSVRCVLEQDLAPGRPALWVGTDDGLACLESGVWTVYRTLNSKLPSNFILGLEGGRGPGDHDLWAATDGGLARLSGGTWRVYTIANTTFPNNYMVTLKWLRDEAGQATLWIGTGGGVARYAPGAWSLLNSEYENLTTALSTCVTFTGPPGARTLWVGGEAGLSGFDRGGWTAYTTENSRLPGNRILSLATARTNPGTPAIWIGTASGLARFGDGKWKVHTTANSGLPNNAVFSLLTTGEDAGEGTLWAGTNGGGLARLDIDRNQWTVFTTRNSPLPDDRIDSLLETVSPAGDRTLWVGTATGLARYDKNGWRVYTADNSGLPSNRVRILLQSAFVGDRLVLWVGTNDGGVARFEPDEGDGRWTVFSDVSTPAIPNNTVRSIIEDEQGRIYLTTKKGVLRMTPGQPSEGNPSGYSVRTFTEEDGLASDFATIVALLPQDGAPTRLLVTTDVGIAIYTPVFDVPDTTVDPLYIERADIAGRLTPLTPGESLGSTESSVRFEFSLLSYRGESKTRYRSQLEGFDEQATDWTADHTRTYTNLPPGDYSFKVWGRDAAGNISGPVAITFSIAPALWRTWWAYTLYAAILLAAVALGMHLRVRTLKRRTGTLQRMVEERTAELGEKVVQLQVSEAKALEANRSKSVFLASMSHELRTPLNAILGFVQLMQRRGGLDRQQREHLSIVARSGEHLLDLINDVLSISKIEAGRLELLNQPFDLGLLLRNLEAMMSVRAHGKGIDLVVEMPEALPRGVSGDEGKLRQVLINLLGNAIKFTETGAVTLTARWRDGRAEFVVNDTGVGIAREEMGRLFEPFAQTESGLRAAEGTGLGLAISRDYIWLMGGDIQVESERGKGARFSFDLPLPEVEPGVSATPVSRRRASSLVPGQKPARILVVDDTSENRLLLVTLLGAVGLQAREAVNGAEAVKIWAEWQPDLIWMDMRMPVMDGYTATREIRAQEAQREDGAETKRTIIIALSASAFVREREAILSSGCDDFVTKPYRETTIFEKLTEHLGLEFVFEDLDDEVESAGTAGRPDAMRERIDALPENLVEKLRAAFVTGSAADALIEAETIRARDPVLAEFIIERIKAYDFDGLLEMLGGDFTRAGS